MAFVYSCCFWFSLRLGGILIGIFSLLQGLLTLIASCLAYNHSPEVKDEITNWMINMNFMFLKDYLENIKSDPEKYITLFISFSCIYVILCMLFIYGAIMCNTSLMIGFILVELARLILLSILVTICLLILKQNTMDIGLLIGASVSSGFFLLGMFYLWVCAASLPVLINEMERDEQEATITKLRNLLEHNPRTHMQNLDNIPLAGPSGDPYRRGIYFVSKYRRSERDRAFIAGSSVSVPYYR